MVKVVHCTNVHPWDDVRIFHKMAVSAAVAGHDTHIVALSQRQTENRQFSAKGVTIHLLAGANIWHRAKRSTIGAQRVARYVYKMHPRIAHFHDPELIPWMAAKRWTKRALVIYDAHEDLPGLVHSRDWISPQLKPLFRGAARSLERLTWFFDGRIGATPSIAARFNGAVNINNYPLLDEMISDEDYSLGQWIKRPRRGIYVGNISEPRGIAALIDAIGKSKMLEGFDLVGNITPSNLLLRYHDHPAMKKVTYHGKVERDKLSELMAQARFGVVTFLPHPNHIEAQPNKLFEYMSAGLPLVYSDFPLWRDAVGPFGEPVNPANGASIASAMDRILAEPDNQQFARGAVGRTRVKDRLNWNEEAKNLLEFYERLSH